MELKKGMYVRINNDIRKICIGIGKIKQINQDTIYVEMNIELPISFNINEISKSSPNIIDLIEVGDYLNGFRVCDSTCGLVIIAPTEDIREMNSIKDEFRNNGLFVSKVYKLEDIEIKSIVTKEQFKEMEYKIGD